MIHFKLAQRLNPRKPEEPMKYYAVTNSNRDLSYDDVVRKIANTSTVKPADVLGVIQCMIEVISEQLLEGRTIKIGKLGTFRITLNSNGKENAEDFSALDIKNAKIRFLPSTILKYALSQAKYRLDEDKS